MYIAVKHRIKMTKRRLNKKKGNPVRSTLRFGCLSVLLALLGATSTVGGAANGLSAATVKLIAPGVWRIRFGHPEKFTPTHFRSDTVQTAGLVAKATRLRLPVDTSKLAFQISGRGCTLRLPMESGENIYGFGLHTELFEMNHRRVVLKPTDKPENDLGESHAPAPFYVSSKGYGMFVDTARFVSFYTGNVSPADRTVETDDGKVSINTEDLYRSRKEHGQTMLVDVPAAKGVDVYVFAGPTMLDAVERYNLFSGGGALPPLWGLGVQYRGYARYGATNTLALAERIRAAHMPCDVWGVEPGWQTHAYSCSFVWDTNRFPDPDGFLQKMRDMNFKMNLWEHAFTHPSSPIYDELKPWSGNYYVWGGLVPDFATSKGRKIFLKQQNAALFDRRVEGVKLDECDYQPDSPNPWSFPLATAFPSGLDGELTHSLFGVLYQQTMWTPYRERGLRTWGLVRNSHALASPLPYVVYSDSYDARCYVRGLVNEGFSGLLWTPEVRVAESIEDFYRRLETVIFSPDALINSWFIPNPPWDQVNREKNRLNEFMPDRDAVMGHVRELLQLRMSFVPYLYAAFNEYHDTGKPPIRALVLDWPEDSKVRQIDDEFMFGNSVLVAPMFAGQTNRTIYLPAGDWYDFWTHAKITGGRNIEATNGTTQIPLFVKSGSLLPLAEPVEFITPDTCFNITVDVFGDNSADFTLYEDDGVTTACIKGAQNRIVLRADRSKHAVQRRGNYHGPRRYSIIDWKTFDGH